MTRDTRIAIARVAAILMVVTLSVYIFALPEEQAARLEAYGYPGIFLLSVLANATVLLPAPSLVLVFSLGARFQPLGIALAAGVGAALGELSGYLAGFSGQAVIEEASAYKRMVAWMERYGALPVLLLAFLPNPLFDITGIAAGALKMPLWQFLFWCWIGKTLKMLIFAYAGAGAVNVPWLAPLLEP